MSNTGLRRVVVLVPSDADVYDSVWRKKYWPNFVSAVKDALNSAKIDCDVRVAMPAVSRPQDGEQP